MTRFDILTEIRAYGRAVRAIVREPSLDDRGRVLALGHLAVGLRQAHFWTRAVWTEVRGSMGEPEPYETPIPPYDTPTERALRRMRARGDECGRAVRSWETLPEWDQLRTWRAEDQVLREGASQGVDLDAEQLLDYADVLAEELYRVATVEVRRPDILLDEVEAFLRRFVVLQSVYQVAVVALWIAYSHAIEAAECTAYLLVTSPEPRSGRTIVLGVARLLIRNPPPVKATAPNRVPEAPGPSG